MSLNTSMLREILTRLAESASDQSDELQNYVLEIFLTLENAIDNTEKNVLHPSHLYPDHARQTSDITPTASIQGFINIISKLHLCINMLTHYTCTLVHVLVIVHVCRDKIIGVMV